MNELTRFTPPMNGNSPARQSLSLRQKAAIIVRYLLNEGADVELAALSDELQAELTRQMGHMCHVDRETLAQVVGEFAQELEGIGLSFPRGIAAALSDLDGRISAQAAAHLRRSAGIHQDDPWSRIKGIDNDTLLPLINAESIEVGAVILSKLDVARAANLLAMMPGAQARRITCAMSRTSAVTPDAVLRIGQSIVAQIDDVPPRAFSSPPADRLGAILNLSPSATRDELLSGLDDDDAEFAKNVRAAIFTFASIPARLGARDVPILARELDQGRLVTALSFASAADANAAEAAEFILNALPGRMANTLREEMDETGTIRPDIGEEAMNTVAATIRDLATQGQIELLDVDDTQT
ncbi:MAG: flagellar motor switch protein FliG [Sediminimonas qiaohouensis]|uniref:Flagellar motor switch protein FliG n=2 Tax=Sediminimonas qiaohouensis TaxID=552061 RepID=A0A7C9LLM1_9RHOB|nr:flagellar motor switch protein FliG [Sediminimonas qiaohouensis]